MGKKGTYNSDIQSEDSNEDANENLAGSPPIHRRSYINRSSLKSQREIKMQRAASLIEDANYEEIEVRSRNRPEYSNVRFVVFPDDTMKIFWDILILS